MAVFKTNTDEQPESADEQPAPVEPFKDNLFPEIRNVDTEAVQARMGERIMRSETIDELFDALEGQLSKSLIGHKVKITDVTWQPYESDRGVIPLAVCSAVDLSDGEVTEFATTSFTLVRFLRRAQMINALPFEAKITGKRTRSGQTALNFERV